MDKGFLVPVSEDIREMRKVYRLNELGWFIWENLEKKEDPDGLASLISKEFSVGEAAALSDLSVFLNQLLCHGALLRKEKI